MIVLFSRRHWTASPRRVRAVRIARRRPTRAGLAVAALVLAGFGAPAAAQERAALASPVWPEHRPLTRLAFGSCFKAQREDDRVWSAIRAWEPDVFVFAGDTLYPDEDDTEAALPNLRAAYDLLAANAAFSALRRETPVLPIWDDHDYGRNDAGGDFPFREEAEALFLERWGIAPPDPRASRPGLYFSRIIGSPGRRVQLLVLDTRSFRSPLKKSDSPGARGRERYVADANPAKTLLGPEQWRWLEGELREEADLRVIVSSIQVLAVGHGWESWRNLPRERDRLFALLRASDETPILLLSGDRHVAGFYEWDIGRPAPLLEFTSSALNNPVSLPNRYRALAEAGPNRRGDLFGEPNFGGVLIDWEGERLILELRDALGNLHGREERRLGPRLEALD